MFFHRKKKNELLNLPKGIDTLDNLSNIGLENNIPPRSGSQEIGLGSQGGLPPMVSEQNVSASPNLLAQNSSATSSNHSFPSFNQPSQTAHTAHPFSNYSKDIEIINLKIEKLETELENIKQQLSFIIQLLTKKNENW